MASRPSSASPTPTWEEIESAHARIALRIHRTPVMRSGTLDALCGAQLFFKCENLQKTGSFKIRGATNAIFSLTDAEAAHGIVTPSSGNHGAAVACAAAWRGIPAWIVMPKNASGFSPRPGEHRPGYLASEVPAVRGMSDTPSWRAKRIRVLMSSGVRGMATARRSEFSVPTVLM